MENYREKKEIKVNIYYVPTDTLKKFLYIILL